MISSMQRSRYAVYWGTLALINAGLAQGQGTQWSAMVPGVDLYRAACDGLDCRLAEAKIVIPTDRRRRGLCARSRLAIKLDT
jgi:hypothetical protein